jgi:hypothetical protein
MFLIRFQCVNYALDVGAAFLGDNGVPATVASKHGDAGDCDIPEIRVVCVVIQSDW